MAFIKKVFFLLLIIGLSLGCSQKKSTGYLANWMKEDGKVKILSTVGQIGDLVSTIGGERVDAIVLIQGELDPHSYELVKGDGEKLARADLIFYQGLGLEHGASLSSLLKTSSQAIPLGEKIRLSMPEKILYKEGVLDPHIWMDISLWKQTIPFILESLIEKDPEGASYYKERAALLSQEMEETHLYLKNSLSEIPSQKRYLVTSHDAFRYFTRQYLADHDESDWEKRFMAPEGLAPDGQLNPIDIQRIIDFVRLHRISVLFSESNVSKDSIRKIVSASHELNLPLRLSDQSLCGDSLGSLTYLQMMEKNAYIISDNLREEKSL
jgi:manganese/zinc/iron transport system substrate-binding protein